MTYNNEKTKTKLKFLAIAGAALMMVTSLAATSLSQNAYAGGEGPMFESDSGDFWKEVEDSCADGLDIASGAPQSCDLWITIHEALDGTFVDTIPAHLVVVNVDADTADCDEGVAANQHGKNKAGNERVTSATIVTCDLDPDDVDSMIHIETVTRGSPSNDRSNNPNHVNKWSPTDCGAFEVNGGFIYFEEVDEFGDPIVLDFLLPIFVDTNPGDDDCDGVLNADDQCPDTPLGTEVDEDGCEIEED